MPDESKTDDVEKLLAEEKAVEERKKRLIAELLKQREAALKDFDDQLAKLGHHAPTGKAKRNHHKKPEAAAPSAKAKA
ncbi:MAG: hypothetical protein IT560_03525 [Alphaproteobacteria bacterium]|nr:hypothetical protein [Alphaproteobacteria bacterium]